MTPVGSKLSSVLAEWGDHIAKKPADGSHWLTYWSRLNQDFAGESGDSRELYQAMLSESLCERLLIHFLELKGVRVERLARINYIFKELLRHHFPEQLTAVLAEEVSALVRDEEVVAPRVLFVQDGAFLAVDSQFAIVTSGGTRRFFPCVDEAVASPTHAAPFMGALLGKIEEGLARMRSTGKPIDRFCFVEKSFGPVGLISVASDLVRQFNLPAVNYRSYAWNAKEVRISSGRPRPGERLCAIYDVAVSGAMLAHTADYFKQYHDADVCAAVVYYDFEEGATDLLAASNVKLFPVSKKHEFLPKLTEQYESAFDEPLREPRVDYPTDPVLAERVQEVLAAPAPEENAIIDAFESYVKRHVNELKDGRLAIGHRELTWEDVVREMRGRTSFGQRYLQALTQGTIETLLG